MGTVPDEQLTPRDTATETDLRDLSAQEIWPRLKVLLAREPDSHASGRIDIALTYLKQAEELGRHVPRSLLPRLQNLQNWTRILGDDPHGILPRIASIQQCCDGAPGSREVSQTGADRTAVSHEVARSGQRDAVLESSGAPRTGNASGSEDSVEAEASTVADDQLPITVPDSEHSHETATFTSPPPSLEYYIIDHTPIKSGICGEPKIVPRSELLPRLPQWCELKQLDSVKHAQGTYRRGDAVLIYVSRGALDAAQIRDIRALGDGRAQLHVCWLFTRGYVPKKAKLPPNFSWPRDKKYIISNHTSVVMWDSIDSEPGQDIGGVINDWVLDVKCRVRNYQCRNRTDEHVSWICADIKSSTPSQTIPPCMFDRSITPSTAAIAIDGTTETGTPAASSLLIEDGDGQEGGQRERQSKRRRLMAS